MLFCFCWVVLKALRTRGPWLIIKCILCKVEWVHNTSNGCIPASHISTKPCIAGGHRVAYNTSSNPPSTQLHLLYHNENNNLSSPGSHGELPSLGTEELLHLLPRGPQLLPQLQPQHQHDGTHVHHSHHLSISRHHHPETFSWKIVDQNVGLFLKYWIL